MSVWSFRGLAEVSERHELTCSAQPKLEPATEKFSVCSAPFTVNVWAVGQNSAQLLSSLPWPAIGRLFQMLQGAGKLLNAFPTSMLIPVHRRL